jgi:hypothetical protein
MNSIFINISNHIFVKHPLKYLCILYIILLGIIIFVPTSIDRIKDHLKIEHEKLNSVDERLKIIEEIIDKKK